MRFAKLATKRKFFHQPEATRPHEKFKMGDPPQCAFCSSRSVITCEYPNCNTPMCERHRIRKASGNLCRDHKKAYLVQSPARPIIGDTAVKASPSKRFRAKGPARPHL